MFYKILLFVALSTAPTGTDRAVRSHQCQAAHQRQFTRHLLYVVAILNVGWVEE